MDILQQAVRKCLQEITGSGKFASTHTASFLLPGLSVDGAGEVSFPIGEQQAKALIGVARKAAFGKGRETIVDSNVRSAWEIDADKLHFHNPEWVRFLHKAVEEVKKSLGLNNYAIDAHLYKLLIYEEGDFFLPHKDSEKEKGMFGSLVIGLPSHYEGGELLIYFDGEKVTADFSGPESVFSINYTAFYADCDHEVKPLTAGHRVCLVYNLIQQKAAKAIPPHSLNAISGTLAGIFQTHTTEQPYIILLGHQYTPENYSYETLKLNDRYRADALLAAAHKLGFYAKLCLVTSYKLGTPGHSAYDFEIEDDSIMDEVFDENLYIEHWLDNDLPSLSHVPFEEKNLIATFTLAENEPIIKESSGYMGNYGPDLMHWYHYGAVMIWSPDHNAQLLLQQDIKIQLDWIDYFNHNKQINEQEKASVHTIVYSMFSTPYNKEKIIDLNCVTSWLINQNDTTFLLNCKKEELHFLFEKVDSRHWQNIWESQSEKSNTLVLDRLFQNPDNAVLNGLPAVLLTMASRSATNAIALQYIAQVPEYIKRLSQLSDIQLPARVLASLFEIEKDLLPGKDWSITLCQSLVENINWHYFHKILVPQLLSSKAKSILHTHLLLFCRQYLLERVNNKPQPPTDWQRALPDTDRNKKVWQELRAFMESPIEQVLDYKRAQQERDIIVNALNAEDVDLQTYTIKKGSPHTLRLIKTQSSYERAVKNWEQDRTLWERLESIAR